MTEIYIVDQEHMTHARLSIDAKVQLQIKIIQFANQIIQLSTHLIYPGHASAYGTSSPAAADAVEGLIKNPRKKNALFDACHHIVKYSQTCNMVLCL